MLLEDYGLIGDLEAAALVGRNGSVDWLCLPRFDSASCFSALLGDERHGRWLLAPAGEVRASSRRYRPGTLVLETEFETAEGAVRVIDFMPRRGRGPPRADAHRRGAAGPGPDADGAVAASGLRVDQRRGSSRRRTASSPPPGPDAFRLSTPLPLQVEDGTVRAEFVAVEGARERLTLTWHLSYEATPPVEDADSALARTEAWWREWSGRCTLRGRVSRRGADLADRAQGDDLGDDRRGDRGADDLAAGGHRRRAQLGLPLLLAARLGAGAGGAARRPATPTRRWRSATSCCASAPATRRTIQIMYGIGGERRLTEFELAELPGYEGSKPVRIGNAASEQFQLDVYGEVVGGRVRRRRGAGHDRAAALAALAGHRRVRRDDLARARRRDLGGARAAAALHLLEGDGLGRVRPRRRGSPSASSWRRRSSAGSRSATRSTPRSASRATTPSAARSPSTTARKELDASVLNIPLVGFLPGDRRARHRDDRRGLARARPRRLRLALLDRRDRRRAAGRRGPVPGLLVLAGQRARAQRPRRRGAGAVRAAARPGQRPRPARRGVRRRARGGRSATSRRRSATSR